MMNVCARSSMIQFAVKMEVLTPMPVKQDVLMWAVVIKIVHGDKDMQLYLVNWADIVTHQDYLIWSSNPLICAPRWGLQPRVSALMTAAFAQRSMILFVARMGKPTPMPVMQDVLMWAVVIKIVHGDNDMQLYSVSWADIVTHQDYLIWSSNP